MKFDILLQFIYHYILLPSLSNWWQIIVFIFFFTSIGYGIILIIPSVREKFDEFFDRLLLAPYLGLASFTMLFMILNGNGIIRIKICLSSIIISYLLIVIPIYFYIYKKKIDYIGKKGNYQWLIFGSLFIIAIISYAIRTEYDVSVPDQLLDSDPYRHHPRTEMIVESGNINRWEPWIVGQVPILEMQGCYVLGAIIHFITEIDTWFFWKKLSIVFGVLSILSVYLWGKFTFNKNNIIGLIATVMLASIPVHIARTNIGFSEAWGLPFLPLCLLFFYLYLKEQKLPFAIIFGGLYTTIALHNMVPNFFMLIILFSYFFYILIVRKRYKIFVGITASVMIFMLFFLLWNYVYNDVSMVGSMFSGHKKASEDEMDRKLYDLTFSDIKSDPNKTVQFSDVKDRVKSLIKERFDYDFKELIIGLKYENGEVKKNYDGSTYYNGYIGRYFFGSSVIGLLLLITVPVNKKKRDEFLQKINPKIKYSIPACCAIVISIPIGIIYGITVFIYSFIIISVLLYLYLFLLSVLPEYESEPKDDQYTSDFFDIRIFFLFFFVLYYLYLFFIKVKLPFINFEIPTFTNKTYRYLLFPAYGYGMLIGFGLYVIYKYMTTIIVNFVRWALLIKNTRHAEKVIQTALLIIIFFISFHIIQNSKSFGNWPPTTTKEEVKAFKWINENLPQDAVIITNWFTGDFVRSYCKRNFIISQYLRSNIRGPQEKFDLEIPVLKNAEEIIEYAKNHKEDGNYYVLRSQYGPAFGLDRYKEFKQVAVFKGDKPVDIYELVANKTQVESVKTEYPLPIGGIEKKGYNIISLYNLNDGEGGKNKDGDAAASDPISSVPVKAWFGLDFGKETQISQIKAALTYYKRGTVIGKSDFVYLATEYVMQYWDNNDWKDIPGTKIKDNKNKVVLHEFDPIKTSKVRVYISSQLNNNGSTGKGVYRAACLEFEAK